VRRTLMVLVVLGALAVPTAAAQATSLVFNREDGNVWLANPDGTGLYQVTLDGDANDPYGPPSQADDGTIVTSAGSGDQEELIFLKQNGDVLRSFVPQAEFDGGITDSDVSPDGSKVAYTTGFFGNATCDPSSTGVTPCDVTFVTSADGVDQGVRLAGQSAPAWMTNSRLLTGDGGTHLITVDGGSDQNWFGPDGGAGSNSKDPDDGDWKANRLVAVTGDAGSRKFIHAFNAPSAGAAARPPAAPAPVCVLSGPVETPTQPDDIFRDPTISPDGNDIAWEEVNILADVDGAGIWTWNPGPGDWRPSATRGFTVRRPSPSLPTRTSVVPPTTPGRGPAMAVVVVAVAAAEVAVAPAEVAAPVVAAVAAPGRAPVAGRARAPGPASEPARAPAARPRAPAAPRPRPLRRPPRGRSASR
jgi:hypothetical protein